MKENKKETAHEVPAQEQSQKSNFSAYTGKKLNEVCPRCWMKSEQPYNCGYKKCSGYRLPILEKTQYLKENGYIEFDKKEIYEELLKKGLRMTVEHAKEWAGKYKYYKLMSDGKKIFYSQEYIESHSIDEMEKAFKKMN